MDKREKPKIRDEIGRRLRWTMKTLPSKEGARLPPPLPPERLYKSAHAFGEVMFEHPVNLSDATIVGSCSVGAFSYLNYRTEITESRIGRYCSIGPEVVINPGEHPTDWLSTHPFTCDPSGISAGMSDVPEYLHISSAPPSRNHNENRRSGTDIGHDVWIGRRAIIMGGLTIGTGVIIGAGAVVTHDVAPYSIVVGVPARVVKMRFPETTIARLLASEWWAYDLSPLVGRIDYSDVLGALEQIEAAKLAVAGYPRYRLSAEGVRGEPG
jgi:acetyltransferase-like isoleucine patch superfamily enzyme